MKKNMRMAFGAGYGHHMLHAGCFAGSGKHKL